MTVHVTPVALDRRGTPQPRTIPSVAAANLNTQNLQETLCSEMGEARNTNGRDEKYLRNCCETTEVSRW